MKKNLRDFNCYDLSAIGRERRKAEILRQEKESKERARDYGRRAEIFGLNPKKH